MTQVTRALQRNVIAGLSLAAFVGTIVYGQQPVSPGTPGQGAPGAPQAPGASGAPGGGGAGGAGGRGGGGNGWTTFRGDAQRTGAVHGDQYISVDDLSKPGFDVQWTVSVGHTPGETLSEGIGNNTSQLNPAPIDIAGSAGNIYALEVDTGSVVWTRHLDVPSGAAKTAACPGGLTAGVTRSTPLSGGVTGAVLGRSGGAGRGVRGGVGEPGEGVPPELVVRARGGAGGAAGAARGAAPAGAPGVAVPGGAGAAAGVPAGPGRGAAPLPADAAGGAAPGGAGAAGAAGGGRGGPQGAYTVTSDGKLHTIGLQEGKELVQPIAFLPANAHASNIVVVNQVVYATTVNSCGGAANGIWALDLNSNAVRSVNLNVNPIGPLAFSSSGTLYVTTGDAPRPALVVALSDAAGRPSNGLHANTLLALDPVTFNVKDAFSMPNAMPDLTFSTSPVLFSAGGEPMVAAATKDGRVILLDANSLGGADHQAALAISAATNSSKTWAPSALATWEDDAKARWVALAATGGITAFKVSGHALEPGWKSPALSSPSSPIVVNDVVFALEEGTASAPAVLHAFNAADGKQIWNSGKAMKAASHTPLWSINGEVYVVTTDRIVYAFGFAQDRHP